ncbi:MAG: hypothetical protein HYU97_06120 [Deltaproteobacteria bacterium]|nr:hypothetical protein [Deltaproteobacteria bacterium]
MNDWWKGFEARLNWQVHRSDFDTSDTGAFSNTHVMEDGAKPSGFGIGYLHSVVGNRDLMLGGMLDFNWSHPLLMAINDDDGNLWKTSELEEFVWTIQGQMLWNITGTVDKWYEIGLAAFIAGGQQDLTCNCDTGGGNLRKGLDSSSFVLQTGLELRLLRGLLFVNVGWDVISGPGYNREDAIEGAPSQGIDYNNNGDDSPVRVKTGIDFGALAGLGKDVYDAASGINARYEADDRNHAIVQVKDALRRVKDQIAEGNGLVASNVSGAEGKANGARADLSSAQGIANSNNLGETDYQDSEINLVAIERDLATLDTAIAAAKARATAATPRTPLDLKGADNTSGSTELGQLGVVKKKFEGDSGYLALITEDTSVAARQVSLASGGDTTLANTHLPIARAALESAQRRYSDALAYAKEANDGVTQYYSSNAAYTTLRDAILTHTRAAHGNLSRAINEYNTAITAYNRQPGVTAIATLSSPSPEAPPAAAAARTVAPRRAEPSRPTDYKRVITGLLDAADKKITDARTALEKDPKRAKQLAQQAKGNATRAGTIANKQGITDFDARIKTAGSTAVGIINTANEKIAVAAAAAKTKTAAPAQPATNPPAEPEPERSVE